MLEPFRAAAVKLLVNGLVDKALERLDVLPDRQVDGDLWIGIGPRAGGVAALVDITPDETRRALGQAVHPRQIVREICHTWIVDLVSNAADVQLRKMMIGWLLQGPAPSPVSVMNLHGVNVRFGLLARQSVLSQNRTFVCSCPKPTTVAQLDSLPSELSAPSKQDR